MRFKTCVTAVLLVGLLQATQAVDWYVATNGTGTGTGGWADATNSLQGAINASSAATFDVVWVSNGVFDADGTAVGSLTNRIVINKAITVMSKDNDPTNTIIMGAGPNGSEAVRCVYMSAGSLVGFTLTNGYTMTTGTADRYGGGAYSPNTTPIISNCVISGNSAYYHGGGVYGNTLYNCELVGNSTALYDGGGAYASTLYNCTLTGNSATRNGGGTYNCNLRNSILGSNSAANNCCAGGGTGSDNASTYSLYNCTLTGNRAGIGGGAYKVSLYNCILTGNSISGYNGNGYGGGALLCNLYNCTVTSNNSFSSYDSIGGGVMACRLYNCIVYFNTAKTRDSNWSGSTYLGGVMSFTNTCTTPASNGWAVGNTTDDPMFVNTNSGNYRLSARSPCINAGTNDLSWMTNPADARSKDLDGRPRVKYGFVDMGAYEHIRAGTIYGVR